ncbi:SDR family NAD(P)-dependent oxidoreductase [Pseudonocardia sp. CA-107938]|uniref:SDR family NAD(P)-dependent oxidoreductase n=1 Tax=Pseudonocardia sp. CA-107938 TaxID=3240021 RepID=UPI003D94FE8D
MTPYTRSRASEVTEADLTCLVDTNIRTVDATCRAAVPALGSSRGGSIVTIGSAAGLTTTPTGHLGRYGATKAAVHQYTRYLANEVGQWGIRVNCVAPGVIETARTVAQSADSGLAAREQAAVIPLRRLVRPEDIARAVQVLCGPLSSYLTG